MRRLQAAKLRYVQEQEAPDRKIRHQEVLPKLQEPYSSQRSQGLERLLANRVLRSGFASFAKWLAL
jgi:hypothetical protein